MQRFRKRSRKSNMAQRLTSREQNKSLVSSLCPVNVQKLKTVTTFNLKIQPANSAQETTHGQQHPLFSNTMGNYSSRNNCQATESCLLLMGTEPRKRKKNQSSYKNKQQGGSRRGRCYQQIPSRSLSPMWGSNQEQQQVTQSPASFSSNLGRKHNRNWQRQEPLSRGHLLPRDPAVPAEVPLKCFTTATARGKHGHKSSRKYIQQLWHYCYS